jgi:HK97 family phage portal protein
VGKKNKRSAVVDTVEHRDALWSISNPGLADWLGLTYQSSAGQPVTERTSLGLTAVFRAVALIAGTVGGLPLKSYRTAADGTRERVPTFLDNPNGPDGLSPFEWTELVLVHLLLHGNAFLGHITNGAGAIVGLEPIHPSCVSVERVDSPWRKEFTVSMSDGSHRVFTPLDLTHIPAMGTDGIKGLSPIQMCRQAIGTGMAGDEAAARMFASGLLIGGLVSSDENLTREQADELKAGLKAKMAGAANAGDIAVVNASLKFSPWTMSADDAQFIESRVHQVEEVGRIFGVPPHLLGQTEKATSWGTGIEEQNRGLARYTLAPWTSRIEQRLSRLLSRPTTCEFDYAGLLQPAPEEEIKLLLAQTGAPILTVDEARRVRNLPPMSPAPAEPAEEEPVNADQD